MKKVILLSIVFIFSFGAYAQTSAEIQTAFSESYTNEYAGEYAKAIEQMKSVYTANSYEINLRLGWLTYLSGLFTESTAYYQKAIKVRPMSIEARFGMALPASALGNWDQVMLQYKEVLKIDPQNTTANYRMGSIYYGKEDFNNAYKYLEKVVNLYPFDYDGVILFAWTNYKLGKFREAKVLFNKALMMKPGDESATEGLGLIK